jgi:pimeloyl-ACP methyl ester carboxylesterase
MDMPEWAAALRAGVLMVNYRGVGESPGACARDACVLDVATALAFATAHPRDGGLGVPPSRIILIGHSIGGGYAAQAGLAFPGVLHVNDRSFSSLAAAATSMLARRWTEPPHADTRAGAAVRAAMHVLITHVCCWQMDSAAAWRALPPTASKLLVFSHGDDVIPPPAQMPPALASARVPRAAWGAVMSMAREGSNEHNRGWTAREMATVARVFDAHVSGTPLGGEL